MNAKWKFYLKLFILMGLPYGILTGLMDYWSGEEIVWMKWVFTSVFFGFFMSLILGSMHLARLRQVDPGAIENGNLLPRQEEVIVSAMSLDDVVDRLHQSNWKSRIQQPSATKVTIKTKTTWWSWGEHIEIEWIQSSDDQHTYKLTSTSSLKTTLADFGQNRKNILALKKMFEANNQFVPIA